MNNLEFRVYNPDNKRFDYWGFNVNEMSGFCGLTTGGSVSIKYCQEHSEQYTGLKDKNGKKIFVGDRAIITYEYITRAVEITSKDCSFWITDNNITNFDCWLGSKGITSIEIIGNIHESKDN